MITTTGYTHSKGIKRDKEPKALIALRKRQEKRRFIEDLDNLMKVVFQ